MVHDSSAVVRALEPTSTWTFSLALALLNSVPQASLSDALDDFLLHSKDVILLPLPYADGPDASLKLSSEFTLRGVLYTGATPGDIAAAKLLAPLLSASPLETLRVILQTRARVPDVDTPLQTLLLLFRSQESSSPAENSEKLLRYAAAVLRERRYVLELAALCFDMRWSGTASSVVRNIGRSLFVSPDYVVEAIKQLSATSLRLQALADKSSALSDLILDGTCLHICKMLSLVYEVLLVLPEISPALIKLWFEFMSSTYFVLDLGPLVTVKELFKSIHSLCTVISLLLLIGPSAQTLISSNGACFAFVNDVVCRKGTNNIIAYAWLLTLYKKSVVLEIAAEPTEFSLVVSLKDAQKSLALIQENLQSASVFSEIRELHEFLAFDNSYAVSLANLITFALPLVNMTDEIAAIISQILRDAPDWVVEQFFEDPSARQQIVLARAKFPQFLNPYLSFASINGNFALHELNELRSYMALFNKEDFGLDYEVDSENTDFVRMTKAIDVFPAYELNQKLSLLLSIGTKAKLFPALSESDILVTFFHDYNGWAYLGRVLENVSKHFDSQNSQQMSLLANILEILVQLRDQDLADLKNVLKYLSAFIDNDDIMDVLFRLFEQAMHNRLVSLPEQFLHVFSVLMPITSQKIWQYLPRSSLLARNGAEGFLSVNFGSVEMVNGDFSFTVAAVKFVFSLADTCLCLDHEFSEEIKSSVLSRFVVHMIQVFECLPTCKFKNGFQKFEVSSLILDLFTQTLETVYLTSSSIARKYKPAKVFVSSAEKLLKTYMWDNVDSTKASSAIFDLIDSIADSRYIFGVEDVSRFSSKAWAHSALSFSSLLISCRCLAAYRPSRFEGKLFTKLPQLVLIYSQGGSLRKSVLDLLAALTSAKWNSEQPSVLSHLGRDYSRILLHSLIADLKNSFDDSSIKIAIYDFLCAIMGANQQGLSVLIMSGRDVFGELFSEKSESTDASAPPLLSILKKSIKDIKYYPTTVTVHLLDAIALASNSWTTARSDDHDAAFIDELVSMFSAFEKMTNLASAEELVFASYDCKLYSKIAEILSLTLFTTKNAKCKQLIVKLLLLEGFVQKLILYFSIENYETSLFRKLCERFEEVYPAYKLSHFVVAASKRNRFGDSAIYDMFLLDSLLQRSNSWPEIRNLIIRSSANMQYFSSQIALSKSVGALLCAFTKKAPAEVPGSYVKFAAGLLLIEDPVDDYSEIMLGQQMHERIELVFMTLYSLNGIAASRKFIHTQAADILEVCVDVLKSETLARTKSEMILSTHRSMMRIIYLSLSNFKTDALASQARVLRRVFETVIAKGTKSLIIDLQNEVYLSRMNDNHRIIGLEEKINDLRLIFSILKAFMGMESAGQLHSEYVAILKEHKTVDILLSLYTFSHLVLVNEEPIFAQLSLMLVQKLLIIENFAESFSEVNIFLVIRESLISRTLRDGGVTIKNAPQLHRAWTNGILPILVTCLVRGEAIDEVVLTLRAFLRQIETCVEQWSKDSSSLQVSSAGTFETMQILYIYQMLMAMARAHGLNVTASTDVDMSVLPGFDTHQKREDFVGYVDNMLKHPKFLASRIYPSTPEEENLLKSNDAAHQAFVKNLIGDISELKEFLM